MVTDSAPRSPQGSARIGRNPPELALGLPEVSLNRVSLVRDRSTARDRSRACTLWRIENACAIGSCGEGRAYMACRRWSAMLISGY